MKIIIIGGVAAGTSAAAKARRNDESARIKIYDKDEDISYSACGTPYYIGGEIDDIGELTPRDAGFFKEKYNVEVFTRHEVLDIDAGKKVLIIKNLATDSLFEETYDKLVIATGAGPIVPKIDGAQKPNVFYLRNIAQAKQIKDYIAAKHPKSAVIVGTGFIGLEMAENLKRLGIEVTLVERLRQVTPFLDSDVSVYAEDYLKSRGLSLALGETVTELRGEPDVREVVLESGKVLSADFLILSVGVRPNTALAQKAGVELGSTGAIKVNTRMQTNIADIYACGDCAESFSRITGLPLYRPLGSTANKTGRIAGDQLTGGDLEFKGILGTGICKVFDLAIAQTGLTRREAEEQGFDVAVCHNIKPDKPKYYHGREMVIKAIADKKTQRLLGVQIVGYEGVDKRIDVFAAAISFGAKAEDLFHLDLAYAPPFSTTKDPVMYTGMILDNAIDKGRELMQPERLAQLIDGEDAPVVIDARSPKDFEKGHVEGAVNIPLDQLRKKADGLDRDKTVVTYCNKGVTGNAAQNVLLHSGFRPVYNLSGGFTQYSKSKKKP